MRGAAFFAVAFFAEAAFEVDFVAALAVDLAAVLAVDLAVDLAVVDLRDALFFVPAAVFFPAVDAVDFLPPTAFGADAVFGAAADFRRIGVTSAPAFEPAFEPDSEPASPGRPSPPARCSPEPPSGR